MGKCVYVSGPLTSSGDIASNIRKAADVGTVLLDAGHFPYVPHLNYFHEIIHPRPYEVWIKADMAWVQKSDALIRLPGKSGGADREVEVADRLGIPIYYSVGEFLASENGVCESRCNGKYISHEHR